MKKQIIGFTLLAWLTAVCTWAQTSATADTLALPETGGEFRIPVGNTNGNDWHIHLREATDWITVAKTQDNEFLITLAINPDTLPRTAVIRMFSTDKEVHIPVRQAGKQTTAYTWKIPHTEGQNWLPIVPGLATDWTVAVNPEAAQWAMALRHGDDAIMLYATPNTGRQGRELTLTVTDGTGKSAQIRVEQTYEPLPLSEREYSVTDQESRLSLTAGVTDSLAFGLPDWISLRERRPTDDGTGMHYHFEVKANPTDRVRTDSIRISGSGAGMQADLPVWQYPHSAYHPRGAEELVDHPVEIAAAEASSFQPGTEIEFSFDGDAATYYHSAWENTGADYFPIHLTYRFKRAETLDGVDCYPRTDGGQNGLFREVEVWLQSRNDTAFHYLQTADLGGLPQVGRIAFAQTQHDVTAVRLAVKSGTGDRQGFASCSEIRFYRKAEPGVRWEDFFTDASCSQLKPGIGKRRLRRCRSLFFRTIGRALLENTYPREFRIDTYRAWPHPDQQAARNSNMPFSLLDNPTGIAAEAGQPLVVLADRELPELALRIQNLSTRQGLDGYGGSTWRLHKGLNVIVPEQSGLVYVLYPSETPDTAPPVRLHFATGRVNGYYDEARHRRPDGSSRYEELLARAGDKYFDVLSPHVHLTFRADDFRRHVPQAQPLLAVYDTLFLHEQDFEGMLKYRRQAANRMYIHASSVGYLYATHYHIGFDEEQLPYMLNPDSLKTTYCWGPAHELGHALQVTPGLNWTAMDEVTNNLLSLDVQRRWGNPSRLHSESRASNGFADIYEQAMNGAFVDKRPHTWLTDWFDKLVPFWQLRLYVMDVCGKEDFYKDVYEASRRLQEQAPGLTGGQLQLEFVYHCCRAAGQDLRPFFDRWGWLTPTERIYDDYYGQDTLRVTADEVECLNARIDSLRLPRLTAAAEFITDNTLHLYTHPEPLRPGTARVDRPTGCITVDGAQGAVAYEALLDGRLVAVSYRPVFTATALRQAENGQVTVRAVAPDGQRQTCAQP